MATETYEVIAEDAPIGIQLWPTIVPNSAPNFTLATVAVVRTIGRPYVLWTYESGGTRTFDLGESVVCGKVA